MVAVTQCFIDTLNGLTSSAASLKIHKEESQRSFREPDCAVQSLHHSPLKSDE